MPVAAEPGRTERKRQAITAAATTLFLREGYRSTSMDQVAAAAAVSKQTLYKQFADKERLFREVVLGVTANAAVIITGLTAVLRGPDVRSPDQLEAALSALARRYLDGVLQPHVVALRRLVIAEAERFPDLAQAYFDRAQARAVELIAASFAGYRDRGLLSGDPDLAAAHFAYLTLAIPLDRALFHPGEQPGPAERDRLAAEAVRVFLAAYAVRP